MDKNEKIKSISTEKKEELVEIIKKYHEIRELYKIYFNLNDKRDKLSELEREKLEDLFDKLRKLNHEEEEMFKELNGFRRFYEYNRKRWYDSVINSRKEKYPNLLAKKLKRLKNESTSEIRETYYPRLKELSVEVKEDSIEVLKERYKRETGRRPIYGGKETKGFESWKESLNETQEEINEEISEISHNIKEEWKEALLNHVHAIPDEEISQDIREELTFTIKNYDLLQKASENPPPNLKQIIEELKQFQATYNHYKKRGYEKSIPIEVSKVAKKLKNNLEEIKNIFVLKTI